MYVDVLCVGDRIKYLIYCILSIYNYTCCCSLSITLYVFTYVIISASGINMHLLSQNHISKAYTRLPIHGPVH